MSIFNHQNKIRIGFSTKLDGDMKIHGDSTLDLVSSNNRKKYCDKIGVNLKNSISAKLVHSNTIHEVTFGDAGKVIEGVDGLVTDEKNLILTITAADCLPIYFFDFQKEVIGIVHAGWRGVLSDIVTEMIKKMVKNYNSNSGDIIVYVGPHIQKCHFEVGEVLDDYKKYDAVVERDGKFFVNLSKIVKQQLLKNEISENNIEISQECTYCLSDKYFSYRRDKPEIVEAMMAYIELKG